MRNLIRTAIVALGLVGTTPAFAQDASEQPPQLPPVAFTNTAQAEEVRCLPAAELITPAAVEAAAIAHTQWVNQVTATDKISAATLEEWGVRKLRFHTLYEANAWLRWVEANKARRDEPNFSQEALAQKGEFASLKELLRKQTGCR